MKKSLIILALFAVSSCTAPQITTPSVRSPDSATVKIELGAYGYATFQAYPIIPGYETWIGSDTTIAVKKETYIRVEWKRLNDEKTAWIDARGVDLTVTSDTIVR